MNSPVRHHPSGIVPEPAKAGKSIGMDPEAIRIKRNFTGLPKPKVPVEFFWRIAVRRIPDPFREGVAIVPGPHETDFANMPLMEKFNGFLEMNAGPLLCAHLHDSFVSARCFD